MSLPRCMCHTDVDCHFPHEAADDRLIELVAEGHDADEARDIVTRDLSREFAEARVQ